jgi:cobalt-zinc-cadmium efflux system membrane fusion protein
MSIRNLFAVMALATVAVTFVACSKSGGKAAATSGAIEANVAIAGHTHEGWWCKEHGVPEEVCAQCDSKLVADFKVKGDWCEKHNRPESQCFICHPEKEAEFAALYEAKFGEQPPKPEADDAEHAKQDKT